MPQFEAEDAGPSPINAWWLSNASHLAYFQLSHLQPELNRVGLRLVHTFSGESTQAFLATSEHFAILAFRGTQSHDRADLRADVDVRRVPFQGEATVHRGFLAALDEVWREVDEKLGEVAALGMPTWYTGHSLGGALATLAAARRRPSGLVTFGSPRVGDTAFARLLDGLPVQRVVNCCDVITTLPPESTGYTHVGTLNFITPMGKLLVEPSPSRIRWAKVVGVITYGLSLPWLRRGVVKARSFADHTIVNYTAALGAAISDLASETNP